jgi:hypothetical protein
VTAVATPTPPVERDIALDMVRRSVWVIPAIVLVATLVRGGDGGWSALVAVGIVLVNLVVAALSLGWAAGHSPTALMAMALFGFAARMGVVTLVVVLVKDTAWIDLPALGVTILVTHLGLLFWELRYVSASLAFPGLKPAAPGLRGPNANKAGRP